MEKANLTWVVVKTAIATIFLLTLSPFSKAQEAFRAPTLYRIINSNPAGGIGSLSFVNPKTFKEEGRRIPFGQAGYTIEISSDEKRAFITRFANSFSSKGLAVINLETHFFEQELFPEKIITNIKITPSGHLAVVFKEERKISLLNTKTFQEEKSFSIAPNAEDILFNADGSRLYVSSDNLVTVFDVNNNNRVGVIEGIPFFNSTFPKVGELSISPDEKTLCIARQNSILLIDTQSLKINNVFSINNQSLSGKLQVLFVTSTLIYISEINGRNIYVLDPSFQSNKPTKILNTNIGNIQSTKLSSDNRLIYISDFVGKSVIDVEAQKFVLTEQDLNLINPTDGNSLGIALAGDFSIGQAPAIQTTAPVTNQQIMAGQELTIKWQTTVAPQSFSIASHKVELSTDGGITFTTIPKADNLAADVREFTWQVPNDTEILNKVQIRVSTVDLGAKRANSTTGNFSIIKPGGGQTGDTQAPMVAFLLPKGGERFTSGDNLQISWMSSDNVAVTSQDLSLSTDGGNTFPISLASGLPSTTQSFSFPIPMSLQSDQARLRLIVRDSAGNMSQSLTPSSFRIELGADTIAPTVTIAQPTANQKLIAGQAIDVKWQSTDNRQLVSQALQLSLDEGNTFATLASFGASDNSFVINNITELAMTNAQAVVRITATDSSGNIGQASVMFSMSSAITNATYQSKVLSLQGIGFISNASGSTTKLFVNEREITITPTMLSNNSLTIKGSKKKLGIIRSNNTVRLLVNGVSSNTLSFSF